MWIRKCYLDAESDIQSPIPTRISSNEEFIPPPQSAKELEVENRLSEMAVAQRGKLGVSRRQFLAVVLRHGRGDDLLQRSLRQDLRS